MVYYSKNYESEEKSKQTFKDTENNHERLSVGRRSVQQFRHRSSSFIKRSTIQTILSWENNCYAALLMTVKFLNKGRINVCILGRKAFT